MFILLIDSILQSCSYCESFHYKITTFFLHLFVFLSELKIIERSRFGCARRFCVSIFCDYITYNGISLSLSFSINRPNDRISSTRMKRSQLLFFFFLEIEKKIRT